MELGVAYLWTEDYEAAYRHFSEVCREFPNSISSFYGMAGVAKWCLDEFEIAATLWETGTHCRFTDTGGPSAQLSLLRYTTAILHPHIVSLSRIEQSLAEMIENGSNKPWPFPVIEYLIGRKTYGELLSSAKGKNAVQTAFNNWYAGFFIGIKEYKAGNKGAFIKSMNETAITTDEDFDVNSRTFLAKLWCEVLYLARRLD
jgi:hypothetical protein